MASDIYTPGIIMPLSGTLTLNDIIMSTKKTKVSWSTGVSFTVLTNVSGDGDYILEIYYWMERTSGGSTRRNGIWRISARKTAGVLSIINSVDTAITGTFAPTQSLVVSGNNIDWTITSAASSGFLTHMCDLKYLGVNTS